MTRNEHTGAPVAGSALFSLNTTEELDTIDQARTVPHLEVSLPNNVPTQEIALILSDACCGLFQGVRPPVFVDSKNYVAIIPVPPERIERVCYKSYILDKRTNTRYQFLFNVPSMPQAVQQKLTVELEGAKFAWLKAQVSIRDRLYSYEPLIRVNWQPCTGAAICKIHLHYSINSENILQEVAALRSWILEEASRVYVATLPIYVPPRNRFILSSDQRFREIAYTHGVSLWTRTMKDSPLGNEWCTLATDNYDQLNRTLEAYQEYGLTTKWATKPLSSSPSSPHLHNHIIASPTVVVAAPTTWPPAVDNIRPSLTVASTAAPAVAPAGVWAPAALGFDDAPLGLNDAALGYAGAPPGIAISPPRQMSISFGGNLFSDSIESPAAFIPSAVSHQSEAVTHLLFGDTSAYNFLSKTPSPNPLSSSLDHWVR